ncbi:MAG: DUF3570 domain-containing protein [Methylovulum sp.]|nr:DUF3570 domain-containing protein [Methylovulum sp.]
MAAINRYANPDNNLLIPMKPLKHTETSAFVACLSLAALALPGLMQDATAGRVEETYNADFQYGNYSENKKRMTVDIFEGVLAAPIGKAMTASVSLIRDTISGASPVYNQKLANGKIKQIMSGASPKSECGASICEQRDAISSGLTYFLDTAAINVGGGLSREHDYTSRFFNTNLSLDLNKKLTTLNYGASVAFDEIEPSPSPWNSHPVGFVRHKTSQQYLLGVSQIIDQDSLLQSNVTYSYSTGYMSDPYKVVAFYDPNEPFLFNGVLYANAIKADKRPKEKFQWAWLTQYVRHFGQFNDAALHADYRFSTDDWGVNAFTTELSWHQPIANGWQLIPRLRYYSQDQADFYQAVGHNLKASVYSSDYRLAGFGAVSGGIKLAKEINGLKPLSQLKFQTGIEYYDHSADYQLGGNHAGSFANFSYYLVTASFNLKF